MTRHAVTFVIAVVIVVMALVSMLVWRGVDARSPPPGFEAWVGRTLRHLGIPVALRERKNPITLTPAMLAEARAHWADHCAGCHANDGSGN